MPSTNWIKSTYVMEGNVLYSHSINLMLISSIKHPHRNIWNNIWPKIWIPWFSQVDTQNEPSQTSFNHTGSLAEYKLESPGRKGSSSFFSHSCHQYLCPTHQGKEISWTYTTMRVIISMVTLNAIMRFSSLKWMKQNVIYSRFNMDTFQK